MCMQPPPMAPPDEPLDANIPVGNGRGVKKEPEPAGPAFTALARVEPPTNLEFSQQEGGIMFLVGLPEVD